MHRFHIFKDRDTNFPDRKIQIEIICSFTINYIQTPATRRLYSAKASSNLSLELAAPGALCDG